jgi:hypothetical protein
VAWMINERWSRQAPASALQDWWPGYGEKGLSRSKQIGLESTLAFSVRCTEEEPVVMDLAD